MITTTGISSQSLFSLNFSATQEIDRIQQEEKTKLAAAEAKIVELDINPNTGVEFTHEEALDDISQRLIDIASRQVYWSGTYSQAIQVSKCYLNLFYTAFRNAHTSWNLPLICTGY